MSNPYNAPTADLSQKNSDTDDYAPAFFSVKGRIGRVRYLAYTLAPSFVIIFLAGMFVAILIPMTGNRPLLALTVYIPVFILLFIMGVRRLHDINLSGWFSLFSLIPLVNMLFGLVLLFIPGSQGTNRYGPRPRKNSTSVIVVACLSAVLIICTVGLVVATAIPAYQGYVKQAKERGQASTAPAPVSQQAPQ